MSQRVTLSREALVADFQNGMSLKELSEKYSVPQTSIRGALKKLGLKKTRKVDIVFEEDLNAVPSTLQAEEVVTQNAFVDAPKTEVATEQVENPVVAEIMDEASEIPTSPATFEAVNESNDVQNAW